MLCFVDIAKGSLTQLIVKSIVIVDVVDAFETFEVLE